jgi:riboflavin synthase
LPALARAPEHSHPEAVFTGIAEASVPVASVTHAEGLTTFALEFPSQELVAGLATGASVAVDGVCLTVTRIDGSLVQFDAMAETLGRTTLGQLAAGARVNVERSARFGSEIGGHVVSGHVTGTAEIARVDTPTNNHVVTFRVPVGWMKYVFPKGFIALDGISLTVVDVHGDRGEFTVWFIPETLRRTTFGWKRAGDRVNVEIERQTQAIVDTVEDILPRILQSMLRLPPQGG